MDIPGLLAGTMSGMDVQSMLAALQQREQEALMKRSQQLESEAGQAQQQYQEAAAAPAPEVPPLDAFLETLVGNVASVIARDPNFRQRSQQRIETKKSDLLKARSDNLQALRDVYVRKAEEAKEAKDLEGQEKFRNKAEAAERRIEEIENRHKNALLLEEARHKNRLSEIEARGDVRPPADPLVIVEGPDGKPQFVPRSQAAGLKPSTPAGSKGKVPSAAEREQLTMDKSMVQQINDVKRYFRPEFTGPVSGGVKGRLSQATGVGRRPGEGVFRQGIAGIRNQILKLRSGAAITEGEARRLLEELPTANDPSDTFKDKMDQFERTFRTIAETRRETLAELGIDVSQLTPLPESGAFGEPVFVRMVSPGGKEMDVPEGKVKEAVANKWKRVAK